MLKKIKVSIPVLTKGLDFESPDTSVNIITEIIKVLIPVSILRLVFLIDFDSQSHPSLVQALGNVMR